MADQYQTSDVSTGTLSDLISKLSGALERAMQGGKLSVALDEETLAGLSGIAAQCVDYLDEDDRYRVIVLSSMLWSEMGLNLGAEHGNVTGGTQ